MPTRRSLLAAAGPLLVGGCLAGTPATDQPAPSSSESPSPPSPTTAHSPTPECTRGYTLSLSPFAPTEQLILPLRPAQSRLVERIFAEGGVRLQTYGQAPIRSERYVNHEGAYYRDEFTQGGVEEVSARRANLSWSDGQEAPADEPVVAYAALPAVDQSALSLLVHGPEYSREELPREGMSVRDSPAPYPEGTDESMLVGAGRTWVSWEGRVYDVTVTTDESSLSRRTFEYSATRVADSASAFRAFAAETYLTSLAILPSEARSVLDAAKAAGGQYEDCDEPSAGYRAVKWRLAVAPELPTPRDGDWYVAYDGERYRLELGGWVA